MQLPTRTYRAVLVIRGDDFEKRLENAGTQAIDRAAITEHSWRVRRDRAQEAEFFLARKGNRIYHVATVLGAEPVQRRFVDANPSDEGKVRFITSHAVPDFIEALLGTAIPDELLGQASVRHVKLTHALVTNEVTLEALSTP